MVVKKIMNLVLKYKQGNILKRIFRYRYFLYYPNVRIDSWVEIWDKKKLSIWKKSWIRKWVIIQDWELNIWNNVGIWPYTCIYPWIHTNIWNNVGIFWWNHKFKSSKEIFKKQWYDSKWIKIEDDVWIWANSVILDGVIIKKWSIIGAGSIVTKNTKEYSILVWNPAKIIWYRN